jgi:hypothetical protein
LKKRSFLEEARRIRNYLWFISSIAQFTQVGVQQIGLKNTALAAWHTHPSYSPDLAPSDSYLFLTVKEKLELIQLADEDQFFECWQEILRCLDQDELNGIFQAWVWRVQEVSQAKAMETMSDE